MAKDKRLYMVMEFLTNIEGEHSGKKIKLGGCTGYIPVFDSKEEAEKRAGEKFEIRIVTLAREYKAIENH